jgi:soluble lytic murein transglycosylase-like protein
MKKLGRAALHFAGLAGMIALGTVWTLNHEHPVFIRPLASTMRLPVTVVQPGKPTEEAFRIGQVLSRYSKDSSVAFRVADALVKEGNKQNISPELLAGVVLTEDAELNPHAKSSVGARGIMQVMPFHSGKWGCSSGDLFNIEANICHGVQILKQAIADAPSIRVALLRYNGCVRGRNTPNCHAYSSKVLKGADQTASAVRLLRTAASE